MSRLLRARRGQAFTELALVLFLFFLVITAVLQLAWLGSAQIRCQMAARRAAWLYNIYGNLDFNDADQNLQRILPGCKPDKLGGSRAQDGIAVKVSYTVPAVGFFHLTNPNGFSLSARSAVIAYNPRPAANDLLHRGVQGVVDQVQRLSGGQ